MNSTQHIKAINGTTGELQRRAAAAVNQAPVLRNWLVGANRVEFEHDGKDRAKFGERLQVRVAEDLAAKSIKGRDERTLRDCRALSVTYPQIRGHCPRPRQADRASRRYFRMNTTWHLHSLSV